MNKLVIIGLLLTVTNLNAGIFAKKKSGRTCIVCKQQMAWSDGHLVQFKNQLDADGKHKVVIVKTDNCVKDSDFVLASRFHEQFMKIAQMNEEPEASQPEDNSTVEAINFAQILA